MLEYRFADQRDLDLLVDWNAQLLQDERHRNSSMTADQLRERMAVWLQGEYRGVIFNNSSNPAAYALYRETETEIYLRQFFVVRTLRRRGFGCQAIKCLKNQIWPVEKRFFLDVLVHNEAAIQFWRAAGFKDYCLTLEIMPENKHAI